MGDRGLRNIDSDVIHQLNGFRPRIFDISGVPKHLVIREIPADLGIKMSQFKAKVIPLGPKGGLFGGVDQEAVKKIQDEIEEHYSKSNFAVNLALVVADDNHQPRVISALVSDEYLNMPIQDIRKVYNGVYGDSFHDAALQFVYAARTGEWLEPIPGRSNPLPFVTADLISK